MKSLRTMSNITVFATQDSHTDELNWLQRSICYSIIYGLIPNNALQQTCCTSIWVSLAIVIFHIVCQDLQKISKTFFFNYWMNIFSILEITIINIILSNHKSVSCNVHQLLYVKRIFEASFGITNIYTWRFTNWQFTVQLSCYTLIITVRCAKPPHSTFMLKVPLKASPSTLMLCTESISPSHVDLKISVYYLSVCFHSLYVAALFVAAATEAAAAVLAIVAVVVVIVVAV